MRKILEALGLVKKTVEVDNSPNLLLKLTEEERVYLLEAVNNKSVELDGNALVYDLRMCWQFRKTKMSSKAWVACVRLTQIYGEGTQDWSPNFEEQNHPFIDNEYEAAQGIAKKVAYDLKRLGYDVK